MLMAAVHVNVDETMQISKKLQILALSLTVLIGFYDQFNVSWAQSSQPSILFLSNRSGNFDLYVMNSDGSNVQPFAANLSASGDVGEGDVSPNGQLLAYTLSSRDSSQDPAREIALYDTQVMTISSVTGDGNDKWHPVWSPDGTKLVYFTDDIATAVYMADLTNNTSWLLADQNAITRNVSEESGYFTGVDWSPDGQQLVLSVNAAPYSPDQFEGLFLINADGTNFRQISSTALGSLPGWADDNLIYFECAFAFEICVIDLTTLQIQQVSNIASTISGSYNIVQIDVSSANQIAVQIRMVSTNINEDIYLLDLQTASLVNLTAGNSQFVNSAPRWINIQIPTPTPSPTTTLTPAPLDRQADDPRREWGNAR
jgi:Tol biopolymer transport system component